MGIEGTWDVTFTTSMGTTEERWTVVNVDGELRLRSDSPETGPTDLALTVDGDAFSFEVEAPGTPMKVQIAGTVADEQLSGTGKLGALPIGTFVGTRTA
jgi:hypothetical protein